MLLIRPAKFDTIPKKRRPTIGTLVSKLIWDEIVPYSIAVVIALALFGMWVLWHFAHGATWADIQSSITSANWKKGARAIFETVAAALIIILAIRQLFRVLRMRRSDKNE